MQETNPETWLTLSFEGNPGTVGAMRRSTYVVSSVEADTDVGIDTKEKPPGECVMTEVAIYMNDGATNRPEQSTAPIKHKALLNVDLGEAYGNFKCGPDDEILPLIDHANVACGFHAGDPVIMAETVRNCKKYGVKVGAHPGYPDVVGFGRREIQMDPEELTAMITYQVGALKGFLDAEGVPLHHVKPHGKLYGVMCRDYDVARAVVQGMKPFGVPLFGLAGTKMEKAAYDLGVGFWAELYGDVKYNKDGMLVIDRKKKPWKQEDVKAHIGQQLNSQSVTAVDGTVVKLPLKDYPISICCHSDSPGCMEIITTTKEVIDEFNKKHGR